jgi:hypothetical protein
MPDSDPVLDSAGEPAEPRFTLGPNGELVPLASGAAPPEPPIDVSAGDGAEIDPEKMRAELVDAIDELARELAEQEPDVDPDAVEAHRLLVDTLRHFDWLGELTAAAGEQLQRAAGAAGSIGGRLAMTPERIGVLQTEQREVALSIVAGHVEILVELPDKIRDGLRDALCTNAAGAEEICPCLRSGAGGLVVARTMPNGGLPRV